MEVLKQNQEGFQIFIQTWPSHQNLEETSNLEYNTKTNLGGAEYGGRTLPDADFVLFPAKSETDPGNLSPPPTSAISSFHPQPISEATYNSSGVKAVFSSLSRQQPI